LEKQVAHKPSGSTVSGAAHQVASVLTEKDYTAPSVFQPEALLREARRQRGLPLEPVPHVCVLDPDGDIVRHAKRTGAARLHPGWACYHTELVGLDLDGVGEVGVVGCAVGASFAVLVAEQLFASGCSLLISVTSAGQITEAGSPPYFVLIERALRDEGTSYHYLPPSTFSEGPSPAVLDQVEKGLRIAASEVVVHRGATWTTDAPFRETAMAIAAARKHGALAVEMEAAALYAFAATRQNPVICFAHVTNSMGQTEGDFEKGEADGVIASLRVVAATARAWLVL
jgi:uridine phosphorylase